MKLSHLTFALAGFAVGAALFRKQPLINVVNNRNVYVTVEAPVGPEINNEIDDIQALKTFGGDIATLPLAEEILIPSTDLIQANMGPDRARAVAEYIDVLHSTFSFWALKWYKHLYGEMAKK